MLHLVIKLAVHKTNEEQFLRLMKAVRKSKLLIAKYRLLLIVFIAEDVRIILYVDVVLDHAHVIWP